MSKKKSDFKSNKEDVCPLCCHDRLEYFYHECCDGSVFYEWECPNCKAVGKEFYDISFSTHGNVQDKDGNDILNGEGY